MVEQRSNVRLSQCYAVTGSSPVISTFLVPVPEDNIKGDVDQNCKMEGVLIFSILEI